MKRLLAVLLILTFIIYAPISVMASETTELPGYELVCVHEDLALWLNPKTTDIAIIYGNGHVFGTQPTNRPDESRNQIEVLFYNQRMQKFEYSSIPDAVAKNQFDIHIEPNGVDVTYYMGTIATNLFVPDIMEKDVFESFLESMENPDRIYVRSNYVLYERETLDPDRRAFDRRIIDTYPVLDSYDIYVLNDGASDIVRRRISGFFESAGLSFDELASHYEMLGHEGADRDYPLVAVTVEYRLENGRLSVRLPNDKLVYDKDEYFVASISVLRYFGSSPTGDDGYIFVPDGSGALIPFDARVSTPIQLDIYGQDASYDHIPFSPNKEQTVLPVFGIKNGDSAFLAIIQSGAEQGTISAASSYSEYRYNFVGASFTASPSEYYSMADRTMFGLVRKSESVFGGGDVLIHYLFLEGGKADYSGMASAYRDELFNGRPLLEGTDIPLYYQTYGAIDKTGRFFGLPVTVKEPLTTFLQAEASVAKLAEAGIKNIILQYKGYMNGGMRHSISSNFNVERSLGGLKRMILLAKHMNDNGHGFFPDVELMYVDRDNWFDGFSRSNDTARTLSGKPTIKKFIDIATLGTNNLLSRYTLSPMRIMHVLMHFVKNFEARIGGPLSAASLGRDLNSDFKRGEEVSRADSMQISIDALKYLLERGEGIMIETGNAYALPFATHVTYLPAKSSGYLLAPIYVPFLQMVCHGYIFYASEPINLAADPDTAFLQAIEGGAGLHYLLISADSDTVKNTAWAYLYNTGFDNWLEIASIQYTAANSVLGGLIGSTIVKHEIVGELRIVTYSTGDKIIVNYGDDMAYYGNAEVPARDFVLVAA